METALFDTRELFGPEEAGAYQPRHSRGAVEKVQRDIATAYRLEGGEVSFRSKVDLNATIHNLRVFIILPLKGRMRIDQMKTSQTIAAGDVAVISTWTPFHLDAAEFDALIFAVPAWWAFQKVMPGQTFAKRMFLDREMFAAKALHVLAETIYDAALPADEAAQALEMLAAMLHQALEFTNDEGKGVVSSAGRFGALLSFICQNLDKDHLSPQDAAKALRCSLRTIHKTCSDHGTSFNGILIETRLSVAAYMLSATNSRVSQIAYSSGFGSLSHFCRLFKARIGESATQYRKRYQVH